MEEYDSIIKDQEEKSIIERVTSSEDIEVGKTHYLSHHPVIRQDKDTTKVRIVYNVSAKNSSGTSLNSCLYTGPCLLKTVAEILARFRLYPIALTADIEKAFLMIGIHPSDRDVLRFLWYEDAMSETPEVICYRFCRVVFGVSSSPFLLNAPLVQHIEDYLEDYYEVCTKLLNSLYAVDMDSGGHSVNEVLELYQTSKQIMAKGGFNLHKWLSNSKEVMMRIHELEGQSLKSEEVVQTQSTIHKDDQSFAKMTLVDSEQDTNTNELPVVLGLMWDSDTDMFVFRLAPLAEMASQLPPTKQSVLKIIAHIFDHLGLITSITTPLKVFLQKLFKQHLDWDEDLPDHLKIEWRRLVSYLENAKEIHVPRYYHGQLHEKSDKIDLFGFCDSSEEAYAASVYARVTQGSDSRVSLVTSKSRVAPLDKQTVPRLELLSCFILSHLMNSVMDTLSPLVELKVVRCWTDSIAVLYWIQGLSKEWKLFIENRVQEVRRRVYHSLWSHCPGKENPADLPTRWSDPTQLTTNSHWWNGPEWLKKDEEYWPNPLLAQDVPQTCLEEMKSVGNKVKQENSTVVAQVALEGDIKPAIPFENFSSYQRLLRVSAYVLRFIENCCSKKMSRMVGDLTAEEVNEAEIL